VQPKANQMFYMLRLHVMPQQMLTVVIYWWNSENFTGESEKDQTTKKRNWR